jgi:predicted Zn-dependent peptidase
MDRSTHQAHVMLGNRAYGIHSDRRMALYLLNNILGGPGMNARLNLSLRERRGLVYTVESSMVSYSDTGAWCVYFGCDHHHVSRCLRLVRNELDHLASKRLTPTQLSAAKRQLKGQIGVACDAREGFALSFGKSFLHYGWERDVERLYRNIDSVTADEILTVAQEVFDPTHLTTLIFK